ncbi:hypothetical protein [Actinomyces sp. ZJ308]|uniref:hypothetical protein n=1 Tax=Actinomyces sp. ZJ308 TaxID=2708342 RepID=UPI00141E440F|nr:hypothetical protein [Actinomyces sp. ZJ308]
MTQLRYEPRHFHQHRFPRLRTANAAAALSAAGVATAVLPWIAWPMAGTVGVLVVTVLIGLGLITAPPTRALKRGGIAPGARWHWGAAMLLGMSPAILLGLSFPVVSQKMAASTIDGTGLPVIVLSVSVAVPWLSQVIGTPVYRLLGDSIGRGPRAVLERYCSIWPALFLWALVPTALEILVMAAVTGWNLRVMGVHTALLLLHVVFVQSLIVADVSGRRRLWSVGWLFYAVALIAEPTWWYLPPLLGTLSQVLSMGRSLGKVLRPRGVSTGILVQDMLRGAILGGVLWSDKFFLFLGAGRDFDVALVYLCLQPAVVAYCYYFAVTAPRVNTEIAMFQTVLKREGMASLRDRGRTLRRLLDASLIRACVVGGAGVIIVICSMALIAPEQVPLVLEVCVSSTLFTVLTLLCYEIDHIGDSTSALLLSGIHVAVAAALLLRVAGTGAYLPLAGVDLALCALGLLLYRKRWASPEYSFFWGKAMSW